MGFKELERVEVFQSKRTQPLCRVAELFLLQCYKSGGFLRFHFSSQKLAGLKVNWCGWSGRGCNARKVPIHSIRAPITLKCSVLVYCRHPDGRAGDVDTQVCECENSRTKRHRTFKFITWVYLLNISDEFESQ